MLRPGAPPGRGDAAAHGRILSRRQFIVAAGLSLVAGDAVLGSLLHGTAGASALRRPAPRPGGFDGLTLKSAANPTFPPDSVPENIVRVGMTYWCVGMGWTTGDIRLWSAPAPSGPWTAYAANPILRTGSQAWESGVVAYAPWLVEDAGTFYLFYSSANAADIQGSIGLATATSVTGPYTKYEGNPVLAHDSGPAWHDGRVSECSVVRDGSNWRMAFMGSTAAASHGTERIGFATATDPRGPWTEAPANPLIPFGVGFDSHVAADPSLFLAGGRYWTWYSGSDGNRYQCGLASADAWDGPWRRFASEALLPVGEEGDFDGHAAFRGSVFIEDGVAHVVYAGNSRASFTGSMQGGNAVLRALG